MSQLCVVWLCLPNLKEALVKGGRALEGYGAVGREEPSQRVYQPPQHPTFPVSLHNPPACSPGQKPTYSLLAGRPPGPRLPGDHGEESDCPLGQTAFSCLQ